MNLFESSNTLSSAALSSETNLKKVYTYWRWRILIGMWLGYAFYYLTRKSFTYAMPALMLDLGFEKVDLGILSSILSISYGISKFLSGILSDRSNPRYFMSIGLILTGVLNLLFGLSSSIFLFAIFWGLNGLFQGWGWPPCARLLTYWYSQKERGTWWGILNTSQTAGGAVIPILAAFCVNLWGWRFALYLPGILCISMGFLLMFLLRDTPQSLGLPPVEVFTNDTAAQKSQKGVKEKLAVKEILVQYILKNPYIWLLSLSYFFVYIVRISVNEWVSLYFIEQKNYSLMRASTCVGAFEIGGFFGSLIAGLASDKIFAGKRGPISVVYGIGLVFAVLIFWHVSHLSMWLDYISLFSIGFFVFGPQMIIGLAAAEMTHKNAAGTATGFTGCWAYAGAAMAGYPLGSIIQNFGWTGYFISLVVCAVLSVALVFPLWSISSNSNKTSQA